MGVHPHQDRFLVVLRAHIAANQCQVALSPVDLALIGDHAEVAEAGGQNRFRHPDDIPLVLQPEAD